MTMSIEAVYQRNQHHRGSKSGWLRAAVLGANDGLVSNESLLIGIAAAGRISFLPVAGLAGIAAGSMSMAVGEYISVQSQADIEASDRQMEIDHLATDPLRGTRRTYADLCRSRLVARVGGEGGRDANREGCARRPPTR